jgi:hypothetical protein
MTTSRSRQVYDRKNEEQTAQPAAETEAETEAKTDKNTPSDTFNLASKVDKIAKTLLLPCEPRKDPEKGVRTNLRWHCDIDDS